MKIGDKVVCVDDSPCRHCGTGTNVRRDSVYVVLAFHKAHDGIPCLELIGSPIHVCGQKLTYHRASRFRSLDEVKAENAMKRKEGVHQ